MCHEHSIKWLVNGNRHLSKLNNKKCEVQYSKANANEMTKEMVASWILWIGSHRYKLKWLISYYTYGVLLGILWHVRFRPAVDYQKINMRVSNAKKSFESSRKTEEKAPFVKVTTFLSDMDSKTSIQLPKFSAFYKTFSERKKWRDNDRHKLR